ncbi:MAG: ATP-dependent sacrificial sulfur transferase LarE [Planctomycetota bacterium]
MHDKSGPADDVAKDCLVTRIAELPSCLIAFSGGVDSAVVTKAAQLALGDQAIAITGVSSSLADGELSLARRTARAIGIRHEMLDTNEFSKTGYLENQPDRCWHCKTELYEQLQVFGKRLGIKHILNGANADDAGDFRPGMRAASERQVLSPLLECDINKQAVRRIAKSWDLEVWNKPAMPCLSSRVVYGLEVTPERLARVDDAEQLLRGLGIGDVRVRYHHDDLARIEVSANQLARLCEPKLRAEIVSQLREVGFQYVTIDLEGFRSGSFQQLVPADELTRYLG